MATDLPIRPTPNPDDHHRIVDPTERVKSPGSQTDPRFKAQLERVERERRFREANPTATDAEIEAALSVDEPDEAETDTVTPSGPFSFNQTAGSTEEDQ